MEKAERCESTKGGRLASEGRPRQGIHLLAKRAPADLQDPAQQPPGSLVANLILPSKGSISRSQPWVTGGSHQQGHGGLLNPVYIVKLAFNCPHALSPPQLHEVLMQF